MTETARFPAPAVGAPDRNCPLCLDSEAQMVERIATDALRRLYQPLLGPSVADAFGDVPPVITLLECRDCGLRYCAPRVEGTALLYEVLNRFEWYYEASKPEFGIVASYLHEGARVLEVGCGAGHFRRYVPKCAYVGLEPSSSGRSEALAAGLDVRGESIEQHAMQSVAKYDAVVAFQVLEHVSLPMSFLQAAARTLVPGGILAVSVPAFDGYLGGARNYALNLPPHHQTIWPDRALLAIARIIRADLVALVHEPLRSIHFAEYRRIRIEQFLDRLRRARRRTVDLSLGARVCSRAASLLSRIQSLPIPAPGLPGHTATALFRLRGGA